MKMNTFSDNIMLNPLLMYVMAAHFNDMGFMRHSGLK